MISDEEFEKLFCKIFNIGILHYLGYPHIVIIENENHEQEAIYPATVEIIGCPDGKMPMGWVKGKNQKYKDSEYDFLGKVWGEN